MIHVPVLREEVLSYFCSMSFQPLHFLDATFGRGGHSRDLLENFPESVVYAVDRDEDACEFGRIHFASYISAGRLRLIRGNFGEVSWDECFDGILVDLGVSSPQLDEPERGFSFQSPGPLDMRMDRSQGMTAEEVLNTYGEQELERIFREYGEIRNPSRVVRAIIRSRKMKRIATTQQFVNLICENEKWKNHHPATRYFMALRIEVNDELDSLSQSLRHLADFLKPLGRLQVISFHSLEDRIVKTVFREMNGTVITKKVVRGSAEEIGKNPRARSAKLRVYEKGDYETH